MKPLRRTRPKATSSPGQRRTPAYLPYRRGLSCATISRHRAPVVSPSRSRWTSGRHTKRRGTGTPKGAGAGSSRSTVPGQLPDDSPMLGADEGVVAVGQLVSVLRLGVGDRRLVVVSKEGEATDQPAGRSSRVLAAIYLEGVVRHSVLVRPSLKSATHRPLGRQPTLKEGRLAAFRRPFDRGPRLRGVALGVSRFDHDPARDHVQTVLDPASADSLRNSSGLTTHMPMQTMR